MAVYIVFCACLCVCMNVCKDGPTKYPFNHSAIILNILVKSYLQTVMQLYINIKTISAITTSICITHCAGSLSLHPSESSQGSTYRWCAHPYCTPACRLCSILS